MQLQLAHSYQTHLCHPQLISSHAHEQLLAQPQGHDNPNARQLQRLARGPCACAAHGGQLSLVHGNALPFFCIFMHSITSRGSNPVAGPNQIKQSAGQV